MYAEEIGKGEVFTPYSKKKIERWRGKASSHRITNYEQCTGEYVVTTSHHLTDEGYLGGGQTHIVNLSQRTYMCYKWQIYRILCSHTIVVLNYFRVD